MNELEARLKGVETFVDLSWILLRQLYVSASTRFGAAGIEAVERGIRAYGVNRGLSIRDTAESMAGSRSAGAFVRNWNGGEWALLAAKGALEVGGTDGDLLLGLAHVPGGAYMAGREGEEALPLFWPAFLEGIVAGYDERAGVIAQLPERNDEPWAIRVTLESAVETNMLGDVVADGRDVTSPPTPAELAAVFDDRVLWIRAARRTAGALGGLQMYISRELIDLFDASGEAAVREAAYRFGVERSTVWREQHVAQGLPISFKSWTAGLQDRDPAEAIFTFKDDAYISDGVYEVECTFCPVAEVWGQEGAEGLRLGYMFDEENHRGLVEGYARGAIARWDTVKTRGDRTCKFRFVIPDLVTNQDPEWARKVAGI